jgi:hypothetical protein
MQRSVQQPQTRHGSLQWEEPRNLQCLGENPALEFFFFFPDTMHAQVYDTITSSTLSHSLNKQNLPIFQECKNVKML